jgi:hypothetical protein
MLLAQHPQVATTQETHLFNSYIAPLQDAWEAHESAPRGIGMQAALTQAEFDTLCFDFANRALSRIAERGNGSTVVLEKTPAHVRHAALIVKLFPEARFIHLVRDPRAVVASLCEAGRSWGRTGASADPVVSAHRWVSDVSAGRNIASFTNHYYALKYEDLLDSEGWRVLSGVLEWLGLEGDERFCRQAQKDCAIDRLRNKSASVKGGSMISEDPAGFYRRGKADSWSSELSQRDLQKIEYIAGELMHDYGYVGTTEFASRTRKPLRLKIRELLDSIEWRSNRGLTRSFARARRLM